MIGRLQVRPYPFERAAAQAVMSPVQSVYAHPDHICRDIQGKCAVRSDSYTEKALLRVHNQIMKTMVSIAPEKGLASFKHYNSCIVHF
jgi:cell shape-determining protein MreC